MANVSDLLKQLGALYPVVTTTEDLNPWDKVVQFEDDANKVASGDTTIAFSGPPIYRRPNGDTDITQWEKFLVPIGALQGFSDNSANNVVPFPEIGSRLKRAARGQANYQLSIQRVLTYHSNILHACYAWLRRMEDYGQLGTTGVELYRKPGEIARPVPDSAGGTSPHFTTFESEVFGVPFGLLLATLTADGTVMCQEYYERCYLLNHGKQVGAGQPMIQEAVSIMASRKVPADGLSLNVSRSDTNNYQWPNPDAAAAPTP